MTLISGLLAVQTVSPNSDPAGFRFSVVRQGLATLPVKFHVYNKLTYTIFMLSSWWNWLFYNEDWRDQNLLAVYAGKKAGKKRSTLFAVPFQIIILFFPYLNVW